jgi:hypothetical protein
LADKVRPEASEFLFPSLRRISPLSHIAMAKAVVLLEVRARLFTAFGTPFAIGPAMKRSNPANWLKALAHVVGDKAEQAYRRSDALENAAP